VLNQEVIFMKRRTLHRCLAICFLLTIPVASAKAAHQPAASDDYPSDVASV
jgi:hypothetical protein